jgi:hypothetical protein
MTGWSRAVATMAGAGGAGVLLWVAAQIGRGTTGGYWAAYGILAGAGVVLALSQLRGRGGHPATFLIAFLPVLVVAGWVLIGMQPQHNWWRNHVLAWSGDIGVRGVVTDLGTWVGVLAVGIGFTFGAALEPMRVGRRRVVREAPAYEPAAATEPTTAEREEVGQETTEVQPIMRTPTPR